MSRLRVIRSLRVASHLLRNWGPKSCFFWAGFNIIFTVYLFFRLRESRSGFSSTQDPADVSAETKGRTFAEIDIMFENNIPSRKFASTKIASLTAGTEAAQKEQVAHLEEVKQPGAELA